MNVRKVLTYSIIGFILSGVFFGTILYFSVFRTTRDASNSVSYYEYELGSVSTNIGTQRNYFKADIVIETTDRKILEGLELKNAEIRDQTIKTIIGKTAEDILNPEGQQELRGELMNVISEVMTTDKITNIYFVDYIIQ